MCVLMFKTQYFILRIHFVLESVSLPAEKPRLRYSGRGRLRCAAAFWERICFEIDLFRGMVEGVFPEVGLVLTGDPLAQEIA